MAYAIVRTVTKSDLSKYRDYTNPIKTNQEPIILNDNYQMLCGQARYDNGDLDDGEFNALMLYGLSEFVQDCLNSAFNNLNNKWAKTEYSVSEVDIGSKYITIGEKKICYI